MKQALLFLWEQYISTILRVNLVLGALVLWLNYLFPQTEYFSIYLVMYPLFPIMFLLIYGYTLTTLHRNMVLSFQCRRTDLFWASQIAFLVTGLGCGALMAAMGWACSTFLDLSAMAGGENIFLNGIIWAKPEAVPVLLVIALSLQPIGAALGSLYEQHKIITSVILIVILLLGVAATVLCMFLSDGSLTVAQPVIWGICAAFAVLALAGEIAYYRSNQKAVVR